MELKWKTDLAETYFSEIHNGLEMIIDFKDEYEDGDEWKIRAFPDDPFVKMIDYLKEKYSKSYCPSALFPEFFSDEQKMRYLSYRITIDTLLGIKHIKYII